MKQDGRKGRTMPRGQDATTFRHGHATEHGGKSPTYLSWRAMHQRCNDPQRSGYGARGVKVCDRWHSFENFLADMGPRPDGTTLDRWPSNDGDYEPGNCRWATPVEQQENRSTSHIIEADGRSQTITAWARELGIDPAAIRYRIERMGWSPERAVTTKRSTTRGPKSRSYTHA